MLPHNWEGLFVVRTTQTTWILGSAEKAARGCDLAALDNLRRLFTHSVIVFRRNSFVVSSSPLNLPKKRGIGAEAYISMDKGSP